MYWDAELVWRFSHSLYNCVPFRSGTIKSIRQPIVTLLGTFSLMKMVILTERNIRYVHLFHEVCQYQRNHETHIFHILACYYSFSLNWIELAHWWWSSCPSILWMVRRVHTKLGSRWIRWQTSIDSIFQFVWSSFWKRWSLQSSWTHGREFGQRFYVRCRSRSKPLLSEATARSDYIAQGESIR